MVEFLGRENTENVLNRKPASRFLETQAPEQLKTTGIVLCLPEDAKSLKKQGVTSDENELC